MVACYNIAWNVHTPCKIRKDVSDLQIIGTITTAIQMVLGLEFETYNVKSRKRDLVFARSCFYTILRRETGMTLKTIGGLFYGNFDHTTIISNIKNIENIEFLKGKDPKIIQWQKINKQYNKIKKWK